MKTCGVVLCLLLTGIATAESFGQDYNLFDDVRDYPFPLPSQGPDDGWYLSMSTIHRSFYGETRVREFGLEGSDLHLGGDLKIAPSTSLRVNAGYRSSPWDFGMEMEVFIFSGRNTLDHSVAYDGDLFAPNMPIDTEGFMLMVKIPVKYTLSFASNDWITTRLIGGLEFPFIDLALDNGLTHGAELYRQFLPYPILGLEFDVAVAEGVLWKTSLTGNTFNKWNTHQQEGGLLLMDIISLDFRTGVSLQLGPSFSLLAEYDFLRWRGRLRSSEDDNMLDLKSPGILVGIEYGF